MKPRSVVFALGAALLAAVSSATLGRPDPAPAAGSLQPSAAGVVAKFVGAFNRHDLDGTMTLIADGFREVFPDGNTVIGKIALRDHIALEFAAEPKVTIVVARLVGDDRSAAAELTFVPDPRMHPLAPQYAYVFTVTQGVITNITVYSRSAEAQEAAAQPSPTPK